MNEWLNAVIYATGNPGQFGQACRQCAEKENVQIVEYGPIRVTQPNQADNTKHRECAFCTGELPRLVEQR